jgi:4-carboxymuconolactone decarboxylase
MVPEASDLVDGFNFGEVWARSDLNTKERMVCILAALMCRGHMKQLKRHIGYALDTGLNKKEICEVFSQAGWYRGWPCVEDALEEAKEVFAERGI